MRGITIIEVLIIICMIVILACLIIPPVYHANRNKSDSVVEAVKPTTITEVSFTADGKTIAFENVVYLEESDILGKKGLWVSLNNKESVLVNTNDASKIIAAYNRYILSRSR
jgi:hypothetical protein